MATLRTLMDDGPIAINLGIREFAESIRAQDRKAVHVDWSPPPPVDEETRSLLDELL